MSGTDTVGHTWAARGPPAPGPREGPPIVTPHVPSSAVDHGAETAARVAALVAALTPAERIAFLHQYQPAVDRLGLEAFRTGCEALHGVAWIGTATVFPQAVGLGATWDRDLVRRVGEAVSTEVRAFRQDPGVLRGSALAEKPPMVSLNVWAPVVNPLRDPRWGRNEEGYSEDPYATGELATAYCRGLRGGHPRFWRTTPVLKHFLAYNAETDRAAADVTVPPRSLHEYELPCFRRPIEAGVVAGVMPGYNLTNGIPNHVHPYLREHLRRWRPGLAVVSDAQAPSNLVEIERFFPTHAQSHAAALKAGVDSFTDNGADAQPTISRFTEALDRGLITLADIDAAVGRILWLRAVTGEFEPELDPYADIRGDVIASEAHCRLALEAARAQVVLLKNAVSDDGVSALPIAGHESVAVIGHLGRRVLTDWYSGTLPYAVTVADGLRAALDIEVTAVDGADLVVLRTADGTGFGPFLHNDWGTSVQCPVAVHTLQSVDTGLYLSRAEDGEVAATAATPDGWFVNELWELHPTPDGSVLLRSNVEHAPGFVRVDARGSAPRLVLDAERAEDATGFLLDVVASGTAQAAAAAAAADRAVLVLGNDPHINGRETIDRDGLELPARQEELLRAVLAANPATVLVVTSSYPYAIDWAAGHVPAIVWSSHAGQEHGRALADVLTGAYNPAGRLPQTWYSAAARLPRADDYDIVGAGWTYLYSEEERLFPFGHGLSYTTFGYGPVTVAVQTDESGAAVVVLTTIVTNTGAVPGDEVVQAYSHAAAVSVRTPLRRLQGFERIGLAAGASRRVRFEIPIRALTHWSEEAGGFVLEPGEYEFHVGRSSADLPVSGTVVLELDGGVWA
jgi:beta-glucosidase